MACPGGCSGGGGQPIHDGEDHAAQRGQRLYALDQESPIRFSHENPTIQTLYQEYLGHPCRRPPITCSIQTSASGRCNPITANAAKELVPLPRLLFLPGAHLAPAV